MKHGSGGYKHHDSLASLRQAIDDGCHLCALIWHGHVGRDSSECESLLQRELQDAVPVEVQYTLATWKPLEETSSQRPEVLQISLGGAIRGLGLELVDNGPNKFGSNLGLSASTTGSTESSKHVFTWYHYCLENHARCKAISKSRGGWNPTRLIDVGSTVAGREQKLRLCEAPDLPYCATYATLSHCWGAEPIFQLLSSNMEALKDEIPISCLTKTFCEAVEITRRLGLRHIWIDSLCIIQDSVEDWRGESSAMGEVYRHGTINIAATGATSGREGLFFHRKTYLIEPLSVITNWSKPMESHLLGCAQQNLTVPKQDETYLVQRIFPSSDWFDGVSKSPLNERGWVLQERLLSPRVLHFGASQIFWECCEGKASEASPDFDDGGAKKLGAERAAEFCHVDELCGSPYLDLPVWVNTGPREQHPLSFWAKCVSDYSRAKLTRPSDKLIAISGIAKGLRKCITERYLAGLWRTKLEHQLVWKRDLFEHNTSKPEIYRAPSWSWAAIDGSIQDVAGSYNWAGGSCVTILGTDVSSIDDEFGEVSSGYIKLRSFLLQFDSTELFSTSKYRAYQMDICTDPNCNTMDGCVGPEKDAFYMPIFKYVGLILEPTQKPGEFRRVGHFRLDGLDDKNRKIFWDKVTNFGMLAATSGLPFDEVDFENKFIVNLI